MKMACFAHEASVLFVFLFASVFSTPVNGTQLNSADHPSVVYFAVDTSIAEIEIVKQSAVVLVNVLSSSKKFAVASFSGPNTDDGSYLQEIIEPSLIVFSKTAIVEAINSLKGSADSQRNAGAALRKAVEQLSSYKDQGGSVLYVITGSSSDSTELELDVVEGLVQNNIQVVAVEVGGGSFNALSRLAPLARATYFNTTSFGNPSYFREINLAVVTYTEEPLTLDKKMEFYAKEDVESGSPGWTDTLETAGGTVAVALHSPVEGLFTVSIKSSDGSSYVLNNDPSSTNWNDPSSSIGLTTIEFDSFGGPLEFQLQYDYSSCSPACAETVPVALQVTSSPSATTATSTSMSTSESTSTSMTSSTTLPSSTESTSSPSATTATSTESTKTTSHSFQPQVSASSLVIIASLTFTFFN